MIDFDYLYGIVTTAWDWHFLLYTPGKISQGSKLPLSIKFSEDALVKESVEYQTLRNGMKKELGVVVGLLKDRACVDRDGESSIWSDSESAPEPNFGSIFEPTRAA